MSTSIITLAIIAISLFNHVSLIESSKSVLLQTKPLSDENVKSVVLNMEEADVLVFGAKDDRKIEATPGTATGANDEHKIELYANGNNLSKEELIQATNEYYEVKLESSTGQLVGSIKKKVQNVPFNKRVHFTVKVYVQSDVSTNIQNMSGSIYLQQLSGDIGAHTMSGNVELHSCSKSFNASTMSGNVAVDNCQGAGSASSMSGNVSLRSSRMVRASTMSGRVIRS